MAIHRTKPAVPSWQNIRAVSKLQKLFLRDHVCVKRPVGDESSVAQWFVLLVFPSRDDQTSTPKPSVGTPDAGLLPQKP